MLRELKKNKLRIEEEKTVFKEKVRISHKVMGSAKISHSYGSLRQRACFSKIGHKREFAQGSYSCAFSH